MEMGTKNSNSSKGFLATLLYPATQSSCAGHRQLLIKQPFHLCACPSPVNTFVTEILLPRYIDFFFPLLNLSSVSSFMLFSAVGGYNLPLFQFSTALRLAIATASPFVSMFPCHPALWVMEKSRHSILSPHLSTGDEYTISSFSCLCGDWTQIPPPPNLLSLPVHGGALRVTETCLPFHDSLFFSPSPPWQQG